MIYILRSKILLLIFFIFALAGCGYKQSNTQIKDVGFLKFNKSENKEYIVVINNKYKFQLDACIKEDNTGRCYDDTKGRVYEVSSGSTIVEIYTKDNNLVMRKEVYIGSLNTIEVDLQ